MSSYISTKVCYISTKSANNIHKSNITSFTIEHTLIYICVWWTHITIKSSVDSSYITSKSLICVSTNNIHISCYITLKSNRGPTIRRIYIWVWCTSITIKSCVDSSYITLKYSYITLKSNRGPTNRRIYIWVWCKFITIKSSVDSSYISLKSNREPTRIYIWVWCKFITIKSCVDSSYITFKCSYFILKCCHIITKVFNICNVKSFN